jgi:hypothetical protein
VTLFFLSLAAVLVLIVGGTLVQFFRYRRKYRKLAESLCDPGSWTIAFYIRTLTLKGMIKGIPVRYSVFGDERGGLPVSSYLLLEYPVASNLRVYAESDLALLPVELASLLAPFQESPDFRALILTPPSTHFFARFLSRPVGLGYRPGVVLWRWGKAAFDPSNVRKDFGMRLDAAQRGL